MLITPLKQRTFRQHTLAQLMQIQGWTETCDFPSFGPNSIYILQNGPKCAISPTSVHALRKENGPKCANSPNSVHILGKEPNVRFLPSFGPNLI